MARLGGLDAFAFMKAIAPRVPVIVMSGRLDAADSRAIVARGVHSLLPKRVDAPQLSHALARAIGAGNNAAP
jgi:DNA-binding NarL/FixJ family response regulator